MKLKRWIMAHNPLKAKICKSTYSRKTKLIVILAVALIGTIALTLSHALTSTTSVEPESSTLIGRSEGVDDSTASGGKSVKFGTTSYGPKAATMPANAVTPEQYGAVGDGVTDDTAFVQQALDNGVGKTVWLSSKTYLISQTLSISSNTNVMGAGPNAVLKFTWFYTAGGGSPSLPGQGHYIKNKLSGGDSNINISNFVVEGAGTGQPSGIDSQVPYQLAASIRLGNVITDFSVTHMEVRNSPSLSITYHGGQRGVISYNYVHNSGRDGITGFWPPGSAGTDTNITVSWNYVNKTGDDMIGINGLPTGQSNSISVPSNITVVHNTVEDWYTDPTCDTNGQNCRAVARGIFMVGVHGGLIANNSIINTSANSPGILLAGIWGIFGTSDSIDPVTHQPWESSNVTVRDNTIYNAGQLPGVGSAGNGSGILVDTTNNSTIINNHIVNTKSPYAPLRNDGCNVNCTIQNNPID